MSEADHGVRPRPVVLFYTDNGLGLGHLTRQAAIASRARGAFQPIFLTMSAGYPLLRQLGLPAEYFPSYGRLGISRQQWEPLVEQRVLEAIQLSGAIVVVVDHVSPPRIFQSLRTKANGVKFVWSRRGLWQPGKNKGALQISESFDLIVEPGDLASPIDQGPTAARRDETTPTDPVVLIDRSEYQGRNEARDYLGIPRSGRALLINLGDSNPSEISKLISRTKSLVTTVASDRIHFFAPLHPLHGDQILKVEGVTMKPVYPIARYFNAFDGAVSTAGYNSFHEIVGSGLPAVFVPHRGASIDDQIRRAEFAELSGRAHWAPDVYDSSFRDSIAMMLRPTEVEIAHETTSVFGDMCGAHDVADILAEVAEAAANTSQRVGGFQRGPTPRWKPRVGPGRTLVLALEHNAEQLRDLAASLDPTETATTILLVRNADSSSLFNKNLIFESVMTELEWSALGDYGYSHYLDARIAGIMKRYNASRMVAPPPGSTLQLGDQPRAAG